MPFRNAPRRGTPHPLTSRLLRAGVAAWLVVHAVFVVGLPVLDGWLGHADVVAHWEDQSDRDCPPRHDTDSCGICHAVTHAAAEVARVAPPPVRVLRVAAAPSERELGRAVSTFAVSGAGPRGPPLG